MKKIKILHVVATMGFGGVSLMLMNYYNKLDKKSIQFDFVSHGKKEEYHDEIEAVGGKVYYVKTMGQIGVSNYVSQIKKLINENGPYDAIHIHTNYQSGIVAMAAKQAGISVRISHIRGTYLQSKKIKLLLPIFKYLIKRNINHYLACSQDTGTYYYGRTLFKVIPNAIDLDKYSQLDITIRNQKRNELKLKNEIVLGHIGRFSKEKNHKFLLLMLKQLVGNKSDNKYKLLLIGDGDLRKEIELLLHELNLREYVNILGIREDIPELLSAIDILLLPSISEGLPNVIVQAQAAGVQCIVSDKVTSEVDMGLGLIKYIGIKNKDIKIWCDKVRGFDETKIITKETITNAINKKGFNIDNSVKDLEDHYKEIINKK